MLNSYRFFKGYSEIQVEGFFTERFINLCSLRNVDIWDVDRKNDGLISLKIFDKDYEKVYLILRDTRTSMKIQRRVGIPNIFRLYKKRWVFAIATCICACIIFFFSLHIWNIEVNSSERFTTEMVLKMLDEEGIRVGKRKSEIDFEMIKNNIYIKNDEVLWVNFSLKGVTLTVEMLNREIPEIDEFKDVPTNIIADKDGVVHKISVRNGTGLVKSGDVICKGDVLVEGIVYSEHSGSVMVNSDADVKIKKWHEGKFAIPFKKTLVFKSGNKICEHKVKLGKYTINLLNNSTNFEKYDKIIDVKKLVLFKKFEIPIEVETTTYNELILCDIFYDNIQAERIARKRAYDIAISNLEVDAKILSCKYNTYFTDNSVIVRATLECIENVGVKQEISF